jgi:RND family efflux transporter MFP subunit
MTRNAFANQKVMPDTELYTVVDLSRIWVLASVFEYQMPSVHIGQPVTVSLPYDGGRTVSARVSYIQPQVDPATRTIQVRLELPNPGMALKPEMFVNVELNSPQPNRLTVPAEAVLDTGLKKVVFVDRGNGYFEPREVVTGERTDGRIQVLHGLKAGERVVTSGNFLINSESQLKSAAEGMAGGAHHHD